MSKRRSRHKSSQRKTAPPASDRPRRPRRYIVIAGIALAIVAVSLVAYAVRRPSGPSLGYTVVNTFPHDPAAFTQGFEFHDGFLYESTGEYGSSTVRKVELKTGKILQVEKLAERYFGEGMTLWGDRIVHLTWKSGVGFVRDRTTMKMLREFRYAGEGWGLTHDAKRLIMSDGTSTLRFLDPGTLKVTGSLEVTDHGRPLAKLNELEMVGGEIYANVWETERIARISPTTGEVVGWINLHGLRSRALRASRQPRKVDVLNGIAYDAKNDRLFVTGKNWPLVFEIRVSKRP